MEIISITPAKSQTRPTLINFKWNNGTKAWVEVFGGQIQFVKPIKQVYWHFIPSGYTPNKSIMDAVIKMILKYSRAYIDDAVSKLEESLAKAKINNQEVIDKRGYSSPVYRQEIASTSSAICNYKFAYADIEKLEKVWRGANEKAC